jgi:hypothetical protein
MAARTTTTAATELYDIHQAAAIQVRGLFGCSSIMMAADGGR